MHAQCCLSHSTLAHIVGSVAVAGHQWYKQKTSITTEATTKTTKSSNNIYYNTSINIDDNKRSNKTRLTMIHHCKCTRNSKNSNDNKSNNKELLHHDRLTMIHRGNSTRISNNSNDNSNT